MGMPATVRDNMYQRRHYYRVALRRPTRRKLKQLSVGWGMSMLDALDRLLDTIVDRSWRVRVVEADRDAWERLDELAHRLHVDRDVMLGEVLGLLSHCSPDEVLRLISGRDSPDD